MPAKTLDIAAADRGAFTGYMSVPESGGGPGLILGQEIFGVNAWLRETTDRFAGMGFTALAPDLFWRMSPGTDLTPNNEADWPKALALNEKFDLDQGIEDIGASIKALAATPECQGKIGFVGFCLGGLLAYLTAARQDVAAAVGFYGVAIETKLDEADNISCPLMLHFGSEDQYSTPEIIEQVTAALKSQSDVEIYAYEGANHGFFNEGRPAYHEAASKTSLARTLRLFGETLGVGEPARAGGA